MFVNLRNVVLVTYISNLILNSITTLEVSSRFIDNVLIHFVPMTDRRNAIITLLCALVAAEDLYHWQAF